MAIGWRRGHISPSILFFFHLIINYIQETSIVVLFDAKITQRLPFGKLINTESGLIFSS